jgi:hypothetical protein
MASRHDAGTIACQRRMTRQLSRPPLRSSPFAISSQNARSTSRRKEGAPGDFIGDRPVSSFIHPAGLPINTSNIEVLRRPVEFTLAAGVGVTAQSFELGAA